MKKKERIIYSTPYYSYANVSREEQVKEYLEVKNDSACSVDEEMTADQVTDAMLIDFHNDENYMNVDAEHENLDVNIATDILAVASLGRWDGRRMAYRTLHHNLQEIFKVWDSCEEIKLYSDGKDIKGEGIHHDGTNYVTFRAWKKNISDEKKELVLSAIYQNKDNADELVKKYTRSIAKDVQSIYGW